MGLVPIDIPRIAEEIRFLLGAFDVLRRVEQVYDEDSLGDFISERIIGIGVSEEDANRMHPLQRETLYESIDEYHREAFDLAWEDYEVALRRLAVLLNDGETDLLDCSHWQCREFQLLWQELEKMKCDKPEFVPGGQQILAPCLMHEWMITALIEGITRTKLTDDEDDSEDIRARYKPPECRQCGSKMKVNRTTNRLRYLGCTNPSCDFAMKQSKGVHESME